MNKNLTFVILFLPFIVFAQDYFFNPFQFGIKTTQQVREITDFTFRDKVRQKAAELLNRAYATSGVYVVSGNNIISNDPNRDVNQAVRETYGNWYLLLTQAADEVIKTDSVERQRLAQILGISQESVLDLAVLNVKIGPNGLEAIYLGPSSQQGILPRVNPCEQGLGQCTLWILVTILKFVYTLALFLAVIFLIWAGILYITAPGETSKTHPRFYYGLLGVIVAVLAFSLVRALERGITGGTFVASDQQGNQQSNNQSQNQVRNIYVDLGSIGYYENKISFVANTNQGNCNLDVDAYNLRTRNFDSSRYLIDINNRPQDVELGEIAHQPGDTIRLYFRSNNCRVNIYQYDVRIPLERMEFVLEELKIEVIGVQTFDIRLNFSNFESILRSILGDLVRGVAGYYLFDPPFFIRFDYKFRQPASVNGRCNITLSVKAANAINLNLNERNEVLTAQWQRFTRTFSFNLSYEKNRREKIVQLPINLPRNTYNQIEITVLDIKNCGTAFNLPKKENILITH
ncbi:MAG: hypothetical protein NZ866_00040 [Patescibacteria group bacterium]|nr:hypothetical protein [Patescibacteria group bacterium]